MSVLTIGGDMRYAYLTALAAAHSIDISSVGLENSPIPLPCAALDAVSSTRAVILPNPWRSGLSLPLSSASFTLDDVLSRLSPRTLLLLSDCSGMPDSLPAGVRPVDLSENSRFVLRNAHLTAEAALLQAVRLTGRAASDAKCLVIGYGRIGRKLACLLKSLGAETAAAARREPVRREIRSDSVVPLSMEELPSALPRADFIFSTPPDTVLGQDLLKLIRPDALLMDLASPPYGFDLTLARSLSVHAVRENGLPGRICPLSAAHALLGAVMDALSEYLP